MKEKTLLKALAVTVAVPALAALASGFPGTPWSDTADSRKIAGAFNGGVTVLEPNLSGLFPPVSVLPGRVRPCNYLWSHGAKQVMADSAYMQFYSRWRF